jgi:hypothetical protein
MAVGSDFELPGFCRRETAPVAERRIHLSLSPREQRHEAGWGQRVEEWRDPQGAIGLAIDLDEVGGYRFYVRDVGVFELSLDGSRAVAGPAPDSGWHWRRYLIGQVLPFAALLQGLEVFHASAVEVDGAAIALIGASGIGKSTLALNMHLAGAGFVTDDVMAVEVSGPRVLVHPGLAATKVRQAAAHLISGDLLERLGDPVTENEHEVRYRIQRPDGPLPLGTVCLLEPAEDGSDLKLVAEDPDPRKLLGGTFNLVVQDPSRLRAQLDTCTRIARTARYVRVSVPPDPGPAAAARLLDALAARPQTLD